MTETCSGVTKAKLSLQLRKRFVFWVPVADSRGEVLSGSVSLLIAQPPSRETEAAR